MLAAERRCREWRLAALLRRRPLGIHGCRLVLAVRLFLGLGAVPLRALVSGCAVRLGLDAGDGLGTGMGDVAHSGNHLWLGSLAAGRELCGGHRLAI